jgi:hypothetical protein
MIQEELLQKLADIAHNKDAHEARNDYLLALLAVVKMHYPNEITWANAENFIACYSCAEEYPCPTIETIIEELA